jgi:hypothetical protein
MISSQPSPSEKVTPSTSSTGARDHALVKTD